MAEAKPFTARQEKVGNAVIKMASKGGMPSNPAWYLNLIAHPECTIQIRSETGRYGSRVVDQAEKAELWTKLLQVYPDFDDYQARTERDIPVIVCTPAS